MPLIEHTLTGKTDRVAAAIQRIRTYDPIANGVMDEPYYVAYSGGKDSDVLRILFELSGVKYDIVHNLTTVDAPETVWHVMAVPKIIISKPLITMWDLIVKHGVPPTRIIKYCCEELKERGGMGRYVATGVRWAESARRKNNRNSLETFTANKDNRLILNADNAENRRLLENCTVKGKIMLNPIIDWSNDDVWEFLRYYGCKSNPLYERGYKRVGCVGCPMQRNKRRRKEFADFPKYQAGYIRAFARMLAVKEEKIANKTLAHKKKNANWQTGQDVFNWWLNDTPPRTGIAVGQMVL